MARDRHPCQRLRWGARIGASEYAQLHHLRLSLPYVRPKDDDLAADSHRKVDLLWNRGAAGIILIYPFPRMVVDALRLTFPVLLLVEQYSRVAFNCVDAGHYKGIGTLVRLLVEFCRYRSLDVHQCAE